jgi:hypothetical protein
MNHPKNFLINEMPADEALTPFQIMALVVLGAAVAAELIQHFRQPGARRMWLFRSAVWVAAAVAIAWPRIVTEIAWTIGIGRGADVILYVFVLAFLGTSFYWYYRHAQTQRQLTEVIRHLAIQEARRPPNPPPPSMPD